MKKQTKEEYDFNGIILWIVFGIASIFVDWKMFIAWTTGTYIWEAFVRSGK